MPTLFAPLAFSITAKRRRRRASPFTSCAAPVSGSRAITRAPVEMAMPTRWKSPVPTKRTWSTPSILAAAKEQPRTWPLQGVRPLPPPTRTSIPLPRRNSSMAGMRRACCTVVTSPVGFPERSGSAFSRTAQSKPISVRFENDLRLVIDRRVPEMDQHVGIPECRRVPGRRPRNRGHR